MIIICKNKSYGKKKESTPAFFWRKHLLPMWEKKGQRKVAVCEWNKASAWAACNSKCLSLLLPFPFPTLLFLLFPSCSHKRHILIMWINMGAILKLAYGNYNYQFECTSVHSHFNSAHIVCVWNILKGDSFKQTQATAAAASTRVVIGRHIHTHTARFAFYCQLFPSPSPLVVMAANKDRIKKEKKEGKRKSGNCSSFSPACPEWTSGEDKGKERESTEMVLFVSIGGTITTTSGNGFSGLVFSFSLMVNAETCLIAGALLWLPMLIAVRQIS